MLFGHEQQHPPSTSAITRADPVPTWCWVCVALSFTAILMVLVIT